MPIKTIHSSPGLLLGELGSMFVLVPTRSPENEAFNFLYDQIEAFMARFPKITMVIVLTTFDGPIKADAETQKRRNANMAKLQEKVHSTAIVIPVPGLKGTILRLVATASSILMGGGGPTRIFGSISESADWLKSLPDQNIELSANPFLAKDLSDFIAQAL